MSGRARRPDLGQHFLAGGRLAAELVAAADRGRLDALLGAAFRRPQVPLRRSLHPALSQGQFRRLAADLGFKPGARPADLDARQWAGLLAFLR